MVFWKVIAAGVATSWQVAGDEVPGTVIDWPLTVMGWVVVFSRICTVLYTPGSGSTLLNVAVDTVTFTLEAPPAGLNVWGEVHVSGVGFPTLAP